MAPVNPSVVAAVIKKYQPTAAPRVPVGVAMAIAERESRFDPTAQNPTSSARGLWQIMAGFYKDYGLASLSERDDIDKATKGVLQKFAGYARDIDKYAPRLDGDNRAGLIYYGHSEGGGKLRQGLIATSPNVTLAAVARVQGRINVGTGLQQVMDRWSYWEDQFGGSGLLGSLGGGAAGALVGAVKSNKIVSLVVLGLAFAGWRMLR